MVAIVTLHVNNCSGGSNLSGAAVTDGYSTVYTNAYGEIAVYWDNTVYQGYSVQISKSGFQSRQINLYNSQNGTTVTTCLDPASTGPGPGPGPTNGICFIVSATTGSAQSDEVEALRELRDEVTARAPAAGRLIDAVYAEYWQFSPALAQRLEADDMLKQGTLLAAVRPLVAWYGLAGALALGRDIAEAREQLAGACPAWMEAASIAKLVGRIRREGSVPEDAPATLRDVADHLARAAALPLVDWAILAPLESCWAAAARHGDPVNAIADWLARAPTAPMAIGGRHETDQVADLLGFEPAARRRLEERLASAAQDCGCGTGR